MRPKGTRKLIRILCKHYKGKIWKNLTPLSIIFMQIERRRWIGPKKEKTENDGGTEEKEKYRVFSI